MRKFLFAAGLLATTVGFAQQPYAGFRSSSFSGVHNVMWNPADIVSSTKKWDVNLLSANIGVGNDKVNFSLSDIEKDLLNADNNNFTGIINADIMGPSFMVSLNSKNAVAVFTRARIFGNLNNVNAAFINALTDNSLTENYIFQNTSAQGIALNGWSEIGATWSHVLFQSPEHIVKAGVSAKLLRGFSNTYFDINGLNGAQIIVENNNAYLTNASASIALVNSGADLTDFKADQLGKSHASGLGIDFGITYEKRLDSNYEQWCPSCSTGESYRYKASISVMDIGGLKYTPIANRAYSYALNIPAGQRLNLSDLGGNIDEIQQNLRNSGFATETDVTGAYKASLPTTVNLVFDYYVGSRFFVELSGQLNMVDNKLSSRNAYYANTIAATPRFESRFFGAYVPLSYNEMAGFNAGAAFRFGPIFVGSGSILSAITESGRQADVYFGIRFGR